MNFFRNFLRQSLGVVVVLVLSVTLGLAQQTRGTLRGVIKDELGAAIVGATVTIIDANGVSKTATPTGKAPTFSTDLPRENICSAQPTRASQIPSLLRLRLRAVSSQWTSP